MRSAIHDLKYHNLRAIAPILAGYLVGFVTEMNATYDLIVPVPLHPQRQLQRGFNQAELLARRIGMATSIPVSARSVRRVKKGASQARSGSINERRNNVSGAFICTDASVSGKRILLIDDVCTTGATLEACALALRTAGATDVSGLTVAREV